VRGLRQHQGQCDRRLARGRWCGGAASLVATLSRLARKWRYLNSNIAIERGKKPGSLNIEGDSWSKRYQSANTGEFSGEDVMPTGNTLAFADKAGETVPVEQADKMSCALTFALVHDVLVVNDTGYCGGAGVYFTGFYRCKR
jgi:hypothetical protein